MFYSIVLKLNIELLIFRLFLILIGFKQADHVAKTIFQNIALPKSFMRKQNF